MKQNLAKKLDPALKPGHLKEITYLTHFLRTKVQMEMSTPFLRDVDPEILHTCSTRPSQGLTSVFSSFFSSKMFGLRQSTFSENLK